MHIRAFIGAALLALCTLALAPVAMADPAPDICVLDLSQPVTLDHALDARQPTCDAAVLDVSEAVPILPDGEDEPIAACVPKSLTHFDFASYRQHVDPGRCAV